MVFQRLEEESSRNCAPLLSRVSPSFSPCSTITRPSNAPSVRRPSATTQRPTRTSASEAASFLQLAHRNWRGVRTELPYRHEPRLGKGYRRDDEARLSTRRAESHSGYRNASRRVFPPGPISLRRIPAFCYGRRERTYGDEKFFSLSRQPKCIPIVATQSISSLKSTLPGDTWRTLLQTFRTKIFLRLSDDFSAKTASELCGREDQTEGQLQPFRKRPRCPRQPAHRQIHLAQSQYHGFEKLQPALLIFASI